MLTLLVMMVLGVLAGGGAMLVGHHGRQVEQGRGALREGTRLLGARQYAEAARTLDAGLQLARALPGEEELVRALDRQLTFARFGQTADNLHRLSEQMRFLGDAEALGRERLESMLAAGRAVWDARHVLAEPRQLLSDQSWAEVRNDFIDLVILWTALRVRLAGSANDEARRQALDLLTEAEVLFGASAALYRERAEHAEASGQTQLAQEARERAARLLPRTAWDHYTLGRALLRAGQLDEAAGHFDSAVGLEPQGFWANYYQGVCAYRRGEAGAAVEAFRVCVALAPQQAACYYNRGLAYQAQNQLERAAQDYDRALVLDPTLGLAAFNRAIIRQRQQQYREAVVGFEQALANGVDPALVHYHLAQAFAGQKQRALALDHVQQALRHRAGYPEAQELLERLRRER
jgi:tetratricopeptide (TPR) repeat protein